MERKLHIAISGAGVAGSVCAHFLAKHGHAVTVLESYAQPRTTGQNLDIKGTGMQVIEKMGLKEKLKSLGTQEKGFMLVNSENKTQATFPVTAKGFSFTQEIEILRGHLVRELQEAAEKQGAKYSLGQRIVKVKQNDVSAIVTTSDGKQNEYDVLIIAEGLRSSTRDMVFQDVTFRPIQDFYAAFFSIPATEREANGFSRCYITTGKRGALIRPDAAWARCLLMWPVKKLNLEYEKYWRTPAKAQKALVRKACADFGWEADRLLDGMDASDDFYMEEISQVQMPSWSHGRVVAVGDSAYCPTIMTGLGTPSAVLGGYVLAASIIKSTDDIPLAFKRYEDAFRPTMKEIQDSASISISFPSGPVGVRLVNWTAWLIDIIAVRLGATRAWTWVFGERIGPEDKFDISAYDI